MKFGVKITVQEMNVMIANDIRPSTFTYWTISRTKVILNDNIEYRESKQSIIRFENDIPTHHSDKGA